MGRALLRRRELVLAGLIVIFFAAVAIRTPKFAGPENIDNVLTDASILTMLAVGQLMVIVTRGIDLSASSTLALAGMFTALLSERYAHLPLIVYLGSGAAVGLLLGAFNGVCVAYARIPPIVTTIGTLSAFRGTIYLLSGGAWVTAHEMPPEFRAFPLNPFLGLQNIVWIAAALAAATWVYLTYFRGGRQVYAVGINPQAARYVSIDTQWTEFKVYCISGAIAGLAGYLWTARYAIAYTDAARGMEFSIIAACMIGGVSIAGGIGTVGGAVRRPVLGTISSALTFLQISPFFETVLAGAIILIAVVINSRNLAGRKVSILARPSERAFRGAAAERGAG